MISDRMTERLSHRSAIRVAFENACALKDKYGEDRVFDYSIGNPYSSCPDAVVDALEASANTSIKFHGYMQNAGYPDVCESIALSLNERFGSHFSSQSIIMTSGAACAINITLNAVLNPNDEVIVFRPYYPAYSNFTANWQCKVVEVDYSLINGKMLPNIEDLKSKITSRTKLAIVNTPNNPSGDIYPKEIAEEICGTLCNAEKEFGHPIYLISDEPYRELCWLDEGGSAPFDSRIVRFEQLYSDTIVAYSFSKSASVPGERVGYAAINPDCDDFNNLKKAMIQSLAGLGFVNASATSQRIAKFCVNTNADFDIYRQNRKTLKEELPKFGFSLNNGDGAFYFLLSAEGHTEEEVLDSLLEQRIICVAGSEFGCPGYVRLSYCINTNNVELSLDAFSKAAITLGLHSQEESSS